jgi:preprotein translocase subunit YajC
VQTSGGVIGTVTHIEGHGVTIESGSIRFRVAKNSICKILAEPLNVGDRVKTPNGFVATVQEIVGHTVRIKSGDLRLEIDRKAICKIYDKPHDAAAGGSHGAPPVVK